MFRRRLLPVAALLALAALLAACASGSTSAAPSGPPPNHTLAVTAGAPHPLTFYEGQEDIEPFTPFFAAPAGTSVLTMGFAANEGAYYLTTYDAGWNVTAVSNGFTPNDPHWDCDTAPGSAIAVAANRTLMARPCADGSVTVYALPDALDVYHISGAPGVIPIGAREPVAAFAPNGSLLALTNDGPGGPGTSITLLATTTWQTVGTIAVTAGLLSRPAWSPDGTRLAAVDLNGVTHLWSAATQQEIATGPAPADFALGSADMDPAGPAPQWSPDGAHLYVATPHAGGTTLTAWSVSGGGALGAGASASIALPPNQANPRLSPDGARLLVNSALAHGQIYTAPGLQQVGDFPLPGDLAIWAGAAQIDVFTLQATVITLSVG